MALRNTMILFFVVMACLGVCSGASSSSEAVHPGVVYKVGDSTGWTIFGDYQKWTSTKEFRVGDTLLFVYDKEIDNLMEVKEEDYQSCNTKYPLALYASGLDSIPLDKPGDYYFISGRYIEPDWYAVTLKDPVVNKEKSFTLRSLCHYHISNSLLVQSQHQHQHPTDNVHVKGF